MKGDLSTALVRLEQLIDRGIDYAEAQFTVSSELGLSDEQLLILQDMYDAAE